MCGGSAFDLLHTPFELGGCRCINILVDRNGVVQEKQRRMVLDSDAFVPALCNRAHLWARPYSAMAKQRAKPYSAMAKQRGRPYSAMAKQRARDVRRVCFRLATHTL